MINPIILGAVLVQAVVSKQCKICGAILGFVITGGILIWGVATFDAGELIQFFGIPLSKTAFIWICLVWFCFDAAAFRRALAADQASATCTTTGEDTPGLEARSAKD